MNQMIVVHRECEVYLSVFWVVSLEERDGVLEGGVLEVRVGGDELLGL